MNPQNKVFIACSMDGYIADKNGGIEWLHSIPNPENNDMGYGEFMSGIDAIIMGRKTFETVLGFGIEWPYEKPVFVLSNTLNEVPKNLSDKVKIVNGELKGIIEKLHRQNLHQLYIDGGSTIQSFLKQDLIHQMIITTIPVILGGGSKLFGELSEPILFKCNSTKLFLNCVAQNHYIKL